MNTIHPLPIVTVVAFLNALACNSSYPLGTDRGSSGGSGPASGGGVGAGTGGAGGAAGTGAGGAFDQASPGGVDGGFTRAPDSETAQDASDHSDKSIATAVLTVTPTVADFGAVIKGTSSTVPTVITVTNEGGPTSLSPTVASPFAVVSTTCMTLAAGATCSIGLSFTPVAVGPASGVLTLTSGVTITLIGTGVSPTGITDRVDLGTVVVGATVPGSVTFTAPSAVSGLTCTTSGPDLTADATKSCPPTLAAGASCTFGFNFKAASPGTKNDAVVCTTAGVSATTGIIANAVTPANLAFAAPATVSVATVVGTSSTPVSLLLVNAGGADSGALTVTPGGDVDQFTIDNQCIVPLAANSFCRIIVVYKPTSPYPKTLTLTVTDANAPGWSAVARVNGD